MSQRARAELVIRGELYLLVSAWAEARVELAGYERVEPELAGRILAGLPATVRAQPGVRGLLADAAFAASGPLARADRGPAGLALYRRAPVRAQPFAPPEPDAIAPAWAPEEPPLLDLPRAALVGQAAIAATLLAAALVGAPFCEKCENCQ